jgi:hypothetical protein
VEQPTIGQVDDAIALPADRVDGQGPFRRRRRGWRGSAGRHEHTLDCFGV